MADAGNGGKAPAGGGQPTINVIGQYVKDLSFENPGAPETLRPRSKPPNLSISIQVQPTKLSDTDYEVELKMDAKAVEGETTLFVIELSYAGAFRLTNIRPEDLPQITLIDCPRLLFPFARQVLADAATNGGFPPLLLEPVDFVALYRQRMAANQGEQPRSA